MNRRSQSTQAADKSWRGGVQVFIANAIYPASFYCRYILPASRMNDLLKRHPVAGAAPGGNQYLRLQRFNRSKRGLYTWVSDEVSTRRFDQLRDPRLRCDQRLSPLFAEYARFPQIFGSVANARDFLLHSLNHSCPLLACIHDPGDSGDIAVDVVQRLGRQAQEPCTRSQNLGK